MPDKEALYETAVAESNGAGGQDTPPLIGVSIYQEEEYRIGIDWLEPTIKLADVPAYGSAEAVMDALGSAAAEAMGTDDGDWSKPPKGRSLIGPGGSMLWSAGEGEDAYAHLVLKGKGCALAGQERLTWFLGWLKRNNASVSRMDVFIDDYTRRVSVLDFLVAVQSDLLVSRVKGCELRTAMDVRAGAVLAADEDGVRVVSDLVGTATVYLGKRASGQMIRFYDKLVESDGEIPANRCELETKNECADMLLEQMQAANGDWGPVIKGRIENYVDFRDEVDPQTNRRPQCEWWGRFLEGAERARARPPAVPPTFEKLYAWGMNHLAPTMATYRKRLGADGLAFLADHGEPKMKPHHHRMARES